MGEKSNVKQNILAAALALFSAKGYDGTSVNELVLAARITKPTLYYHFGSKEGLFDAVCQENYERLNAAIAENASYREDISKTLTNITIAYFSFATENEMFYRLAMANLHMPLSSTVYNIAKKCHHKQHEIVEKVFAQVSKSHDLRGMGKQISHLFIGSINSCITLSHTGLHESELDADTAKRLVHWFIHGFIPTSPYRNNYQYSTSINRY